MDVIVHGSILLYIICSVHSLLEISPFDQSDDVMNLLYICYDD